MKKYLLLFLSIGLILTSCKKSDDDLTPPDGIDPDPTANVEVQDFMWKAMNFWYFWQRYLFKKISFEKLNVFPLHLP